MTDPTTDDAGRYGRARSLRSPHRWVAVAVGLLGVATAAAAAVLVYQRFSAPDVKGALSGYRLIDDETVSVTVSVTRSDPSRPVVCIVRARAMDGSESGRREVLVPPGTAGTVQVTTIVKSAQPPVLGDVYGCGTDIPDYLRSS